MRTWNAFLVAAALLAVSACDSQLQGPDDDDNFEARLGEIYETPGGRERKVRVDIDGLTYSGQGIVLYDGRQSREVMSGPAVVRAGVPFDVTVYTFTGDGDEALPSEVSVADRTATIAVRDNEYVKLRNAIRTFTPRTDRITFTTPGEAEIVIKGFQSDIQNGGFIDREIRFPVVVTE